MSKKDFIALADAIRQHNADAKNNPDSGMAPFASSQLGTLAKFCRTQNPHFMQGRWFSYIAGECGKNGGAIKGSKA